MNNETRKRIDEAFRKECLKDGCVEIITSNGSCFTKKEDLEKLSHAIYGAFNWSGTEEGLEYWSDVDSKVQAILEKVKKAELRSI